MEKRSPVSCQTYISKSQLLKFSVVVLQLIDNDIVEGFLFNAVMAGGLLLDLLVPLVVFVVVLKNLVCYLTDSTIFPA